MLTTGSGARAPAGIDAAVRKIFINASKRRCASVRGSSDAGASGPCSSVRAATSARNSSSTNRSKMPEHLRRVERPPSAGPQVEATVDLVQPGGAVGVIRLGIVERAVLVGEVLPPPHDGAEVLEREMLGVVEQQVEHVDEVGHRSVDCCGPWRIRRPAHARYGRPATHHQRRDTIRTRRRRAAWSSTSHAGPIARSLASIP